MATGGVSPETEDPMICHICMEVYRNPKFLPCFHSFCAQCIQDWASQNRSRSRSSFPCPVCRQETSLPKGGVEKLQTNFYLNEKTLEKVRTGKLCHIHQNQVLELFCVRCQQVICPKCGVLNHGSHQILDLDLVVHQKKKELLESRQLVQTTIGKLRECKKQALSGQKRNQEQLYKAQDVVHSMITRVYIALHSGAQNYLRFCYNVFAHGEADSLGYLLTHEQKMDSLDEQLMEAVKSEKVEKMSTVIKKLKSGRGMKNTNFCYPSFYQFMFFFHVFVFTLIIIFSTTLLCKVQERATIRDFETFEIVSFMPFTMMEQYKYVGERDIEVYSLCGTSSGFVVSYMRPGLKEGADSQAFTTTGQMVAKHVNVTGKATWVRMNHSCVSFDSTSTFSKSKKLFVLSKASSKVSVIGHYTPRTTEETEDVHFNTIVLFRINVQKFRTFDADSRGNFFAVIEEGKSPNLQRRVKIFRKSHSTPFATYAPHDMTFQPADVCFYEIQGEEVLLVADEWNQHIHVVRVAHSVVKPLGYLESGCLESRTPTALNVDDEGDLWVACKGGNIVKTKYWVFLKAIETMMMKYIWKYWNSWLD